MAGKNTISITFKVDGDGKGFRTLAVDAQGLKKLLQSTTSEADQLKKSLVNWSQATQAISAVTDVVSDMASAMSQLSDKMRDTQRQNVLVTQLTGKTGEEMLRLRNSVRAVSDHFGLDFYETLRAANNLANAFGITVDDAMKLMRDGLVSGANANGEFIDTIREYPRYFKEAGLSAEELSLTRIMGCSFPFLSSFRRLHFAGVIRWRSGTGWCSCPAQRPARRRGRRCCRRCSAGRGPPRSRRRRCGPPPGRRSAPRGRRRGRRG